MMAPPPGTSHSPFPRTVPASEHSSTFDYVIVGGGAAGCVLANRLSENPDISVLVLEAGGPPDSFYLNTPLGFPYLLGSPYDWAFVTEPEPHLGGRRLYFPRGKVLGGSHAISVMLYHRGHANDYREWEKVAPGWGPADVLPYFKKSQQQLGRVDNRDVHGYDGVLAVDDLARVNPMSKGFVEAGRACGMRANDDFNDWKAGQEGIGVFQVTQRDGVRESPATSYLRAAQGRRNLRVESGCIVERVVWGKGEDGPVAEGVSVIDSKGKRWRAGARREIVLAGGVYASPQLLMLSGVGPAEHLQQMGVEVVSDLEGVGKNLQDHPAAVVSFESQRPLEDKRKTAVYYTEKTGKNIGTLLNYLFRGKGPLTSPMCEAGGFVKTEEGLEACDLQLRFVPFVSEPDPYHSLADFATAGSYLRNRANRPAGFTLQSVAARPRSRGYVELRSTDVRDSMRIRGNWMSDERDMNTLMQGIKLCRKIAMDDRMKEYRGRELYPGGEVVSDADIEQYIRDTCHTANAMVGTCRMGTDHGAVVDTELKVKGVSRLRVVDSSVMPTLPGGQSGAPTMMIAEKGADLIREAALNADYARVSRGVA